MAALSVSHHSLHRKIKAMQELTARNFPRTTSFSIATCCHNTSNPEKPNMKKKPNPSPTPSPSILGGVEKLGKGLRDSLSPQRKGDWKDLTLMSLSFAVYVYMSQKIVCAYCAWVYMPKQPW